MAAEYTTGLYKQLAQIPDPEIPVLTIGDLGMLREVNQVGEELVVTITPTYTACPAMPWIEERIRAVLAAHGIHRVAVRTVYSPAWTTDWLSREAKEKLRQYGIAPPAHSSCANARPVDARVQCPRCNSLHTVCLSRFGSTACKALYRCNQCKEVFDHFKCH